MTIDLWLLIAAAALTWILVMAEATLTIVDRGPTAASGNRDDFAATAPGLHGRVKRCVTNMYENLPLFAIVVLVAHVSGEADRMSALGSQVFVGARVVHAGLYAVGVPWLRTGAWMVSIAGIAMIVASLFG